MPDQRPVHAGVGHLLEELLRSVLEVALIVPAPQLHVGIEHRNRRFEVEVDFAHQEVTFAGADRYWWRIDEAQSFRFRSRMALPPRTIFFSSSVIWQTITFASCWEASNSGMSVPKRTRSALPFLTAYSMPP